MFLDALSYPIRQSGWMMILMGAIFAVVLDLLQSAPIVGIAVAVFSGGYFGSFYLSIVETTIAGRASVPDWPSFTSFIDDVLMPFVRLLGLSLISFFPLLLLFIFGPEEAAWYLPAVLAGVLLGSFYLPMAVVASLVFGNLLAALPHVVIPAILKASPSYLGGVGGLIALVIVGMIIEEWGGRVPYVGVFLAAIVGLYFLMFQGRLIGLIYERKRDRLGWE